MSLDLLPNNSTKLERGIAHSSDPIPPLGTILERIRDGKRVNIPDAVVDWLIYEYGLGEVTPYLTDPRQALREGVQWQRVRGTPAAVALGLGWIDFPAVVEESEAGTLRWAEISSGSRTAQLITARSPESSVLAESRSRHALGCSASMGAGTTSDGSGSTITF